MVTTNLLNNSWPSVRVRITRTGTTEIGCSGDRFAIKPATLALEAFDGTWQSAGTTRTLYNIGTSGGNVHAASTSSASVPRPFTLRVTAKNGAASPATTTNYAGTPTAKNASPACVTPSGCTTGTLSLGAWTAASGVITSNTAHYSEAGTFNLEVEDATFSAVDTADTALSVRTVAQGSPAPRELGRFVPDRFTFTLPSTPVLQTFGASCASARPFTYIGQPFWYTTAPSATLQAVNANGAVTTNYRGSLFKLVGSNISETYSNNSVGPSITVTATTASLSPTGNGTAPYGAGGTALTYDRSTTHPPAFAPYNAKISLSVSATDGNENGIAGNPGNGATPALTTPSPLVFDGGGSGIAFDSLNDFNTGAGLTAGKTFIYGLMRLDYVTGPENVDHPVLLQAQYWNGTSFARNTQDNCTSLIPKNFVLSGHQGALTTGNMVSPTGATNGNVSISGTLTAGFANLKVLAPTSAITAPGSVRICLDLDSGAGGDTACQAATPAGKTFLQGRWTLVGYDKDPFNTVGFGIYGAQPRNFIYFRENY